MALKDDLRSELIKQFAAEVVQVTDEDGNQYYACPTCKHHVAMSNDKCNSCNQTLNWQSIRQEIYKKSGAKKAVLSFEVPGDFVKSDCRKCPISYIAKKGKETIYECPLNMRNSCKLEIKPV